jgi:ubiquinone biosynthesis protein
MTSLLRRHRLQLAPRFSLLLKALATIESTAKALDPKVDFVEVIRPYVERVVKDRYSPDALMEQGQHSLIALLRAGSEMPHDLRELVRQLRHGRLNIQLNHRGLERLAAVTDRASNRIAFSVITAALIVGSSLLMATGGDGSGHKLGLVGYTIAGVFGVMLLVSILRSRNY